eukprot:SAG25_NODE_339_length_9497_cov_2.975109_5_plen_144_part_00
MSAPGAAITNVQPPDGRVRDRQPALACAPLRSDTAAAAAPAPRCAPGDCAAAGVAALDVLMFARRWGAAGLLPLRPAPGCLHCCLVPHCLRRLTASCWLLVTRAASSSRRMPGRESHQGMSSISPRVLLLILIRGILLEKVLF